MSYDKIIGFGINPDKPKGPLRALSPKESMYFERMGIEPIFIDQKKWMPAGNREPEQKLFVPSAKGFNKARALITNARNAFLIPGQVYDEKNPLTSILADNGQLDRDNNTLRYRFESDPVTGRVTQGDFNEKSGMKNSDIIGGCIDRFEREREQKKGETMEAAYKAFIMQQRHKKDPAFADKIKYGELMVGAGYQAARNELGIAFRHPVDNVMFVFEACEDFWHANAQDMTQILASFHEWEIETKQIWGRLPSNIRCEDDFKNYVYSAMTMFRDYMHMNIPGSSINMKSKAEITKEHLADLHGFENVDLQAMGLTRVFQDATPTGYHDEVSAFGYSLMLGGTLESTMQSAQKAIHDNGARLHKEKERFNETAIKPDLDSIGYGTYDIPSVILKPAPQPVANYS